MIKQLTTIEDLSASGTLHYLASPYSKSPLGLEGAFIEISRIAARLVEKGVPLFSPISHSHSIAIHGDLDPYSHDIWLPADEHLMRVCGAMVIAAMEGWHVSYGIGEEIKAFRAAEKPIFLLDPTTLAVEIYEGGSDDGHVVDTMAATTPARAG